MEWHQLYFEMVYRLVRKQNEWLLEQVALRENVPFATLKPLLPSMSQLRGFTHRLPPRPKGPARTRPLDQGAERFPEGGAPPVPGTP